MGGAQHQLEPQIQTQPQRKKTQDDTIRGVRSERGSGGRDTNGEPGQPTKDSPRSPKLRVTAEDLADHPGELLILKKKSPVTLEKIQLVKNIFPGAKVVK